MERPTNPTCLPLTVQGAGAVQSVGIQFDDGAQSRPLAIESFDSLQVLTRN